MAVSAEPRSPYRRASFLCSFPRSGRTWLRFMLAHYLNDVFDLAVGIDFRTVFSIVPNRGRNPGKGTPAFLWWDRPEVPLVLCDHGLRGPGHAGHSVAFLLRSPFDVLVSYYHQCVEGLGIFRGTLTAFLHHPSLGVLGLSRYLKSWAAVPEEPGALVLRYETLRADPGEGLGRLVAWLGLPDDASAKEAAVEACTFEAMRALELSGVDDRSEAWRVRRGGSGGYRDEMTPNDVAFVRAVLLTELGPPLARWLGVADDDGGNPPPKESEVRACVSSTES